MSDRICTSQKNWLAKLARAYRKRRSVTLVDDAGVGVDVEHETLFEMGKKAGVTGAEWAAVLIALGMCGLGVWMLRLAILDPEPTSKLWLLVGGGTVAVLGGGFTAIQILTNVTPPDVKVTPDGVEISWSDTSSTSGNAEQEDKAGFAAA